MEVGFFVAVVFEDGVLGGAVGVGGAVVEVHRGFGVADGFFFLGDALVALGDAAEVFADLAVAFDAVGEVAATGLVPVEDATGFFDDVVEDPLLAVALQSHFSHGFPFSVVASRSGSGARDGAVARRQATTR